MYEIIKVGSMYHVVSKESRIVQFRSMVRANCRDWLANIAKQVDEK